MSSGSKIGLIESLLVSAMVSFLYIIKTHNRDRLFFCAFGVIVVMSVHMDGFVDNWFLVSVFISPLD